MISLAAGSANELFSAACHRVLNLGQVAAPRGLKTIEVLGAHLTLTAPQRRLIEVPPVRVLNTAFAVAETVWILSGSDEQWIYTYNQRLTEFTDHGVLKGAYGPRLRRWAGRVDQLDHARRVLTADPDSRRAIIQLYDPGRDDPAHKDVPCTLGYRFYLRAGRLDMHTTMRSQDLWLGFCYDIFTNTVLHELMAAWLGAELGHYHHHVDSLHLYERHLASAAQLCSEVTPSALMEPLAVSWDEFDPLLRRVTTAEGKAEGGWGRFADAMRSYRMWRSGDRDAARLITAEAHDVVGRSLHSWYGHLEALGRQG